MPPQDTSDGEGDESPVFGQTPGHDLADPESWDDSEDDPPPVTTDIPELLGADESGRKNTKPTRKHARFSEKVEIILEVPETNGSFEGRAAAAATRGGRKGRGKKAERSSSTGVALEDTEDHDMDSEDSDAHQAHEIVSHLDKKAEQQRQSRQKGKQTAEDMTEDMTEDMIEEMAEEGRDTEVSKPAKKRGRIPKSTKKVDAIQVTTKSAQSGGLGRGRGRPAMQASRKTSMPQPSLGQGNKSASSPLKRKGSSKVGAEGTPRRSARAAAIAVEAEKAKVADDKKVDKTRDATPTPKRRRTTSKKGGDNQNAVYVVEKIVGHRIDKKTGKSTFEVKWKNYPASQNTWEPKENLAGCSAKLKEYLAKIK